MTLISLVVWLTLILVVGLATVIFSRFETAGLLTELDGSAAPLSRGSFVAVTLAIAAEWLVRALSDLGQPALPDLSNQELLALAAGASLYLGRKSAAHNDNGVAANLLQLLTGGKQ